MNNVKIKGIEKTKIKCGIEKKTKTYLMVIYIKVSVRKTVTSECLK